MLPSTVQFIVAMLVYVLNERMVRKAGFVIFGERNLRNVVKHFVDYHLTGRVHQGIGSRIIQPNPSPSSDNGNLGPLRWRSHLGGMLNPFYRAAA